jgi:hypothetical protein
VLRGKVAHEQVAAAVNRGSAELGRNSGCSAGRRRDIDREVAAERVAGVVISEDLAISGCEVDVSAARQSGVVGR